MENKGLRVANRNIYCNVANVLPARCVSAAVISRNVGILSGKYVLLDDFLNQLCQLRVVNFFMFVLLFFTCLYS